MRPREGATRGEASSAVARFRDRLRTDPRFRGRVAATTLALVTGVTVLVLSHRVFPHLTTNHDEAVYLQQAAMLLDGQLFLTPPVETTFRPWFFVNGSEGLYAKYSPVTAAVFAVGLALGDPRLSLAAVAAALIALTYAVGCEAFDRRTALLGSVLVAGTPFVLVQTAAFLPYAPTLAFELGFAWAYLRATRTGSRRWAAGAGLAIGTAFFARPYTAVLFAAPFVCHAMWTLGRGRTAFLRQSLVAAAGLCGVAATLAYNARMTGDPLTFPYQAFAPQDGLGFGTRRILGYERDYTPALALRANAEAAWVLFTRWIVAGPLGTAWAALGLGATALRVRRALDRADPQGLRAVVRPDGGTPAVDTGGDGDRLAPRLILAGLFPAVLLGNVPFWGSLNVLGELDRAGDGLISFYGPYYHLDLVVPTALFAALALGLLADRWRALVRERVGSGRPRDESPARTDGGTGRRARRVALAGLLVGGLLIGGASVGMAAAPLAENRAVSDQLDTAYEPFEPQAPAGVVFLPTPYGDWLNHPFQQLRNDPDFDGRTVYAMRENQFAVVDAYPDRRLYRYSYRGEWEPFLGSAVAPRLTPVRHARGNRVDLHATLGVPAGVDTASVRLAAGNESSYYAVRGPPESIDARVVMTDGRARLAGPDLVPVDPAAASVPIDARDELLVEANLEFAPGNAFTYRLETPVKREGDTVRVLTPHAEVCRGANLCDGEAAYVPAVARPGVAVDTRLTPYGAVPVNRSDLRGAHP